MIISNCATNCFKKSDNKKYLVLFFLLISKLSFSQAPTLNSPESNKYYTNPVPVSLTIPVTYLSGSLKLTFTNSAGNYSNTLTLVDNILTQTITLTTNNIIGPNITSSTYSTLPDDTYNVTLVYKDINGNTATPTTNSNIVIQTHTPQPTLTSPTNGFSFNSGSSLRFNYTLPSAPYSGTVALSLNPGYTYTLANQSGTNTYTINTTIVDGNYTATVSYQDFLGNPTSSSTPVGLTIDRVTLTPSFSSPANNSINSGTETMTFTTPESALSGSKKFTISQNQTVLTTLILNDNNNGTLFLNFKNLNQNASQYSAITGSSSIADGTYVLTYSYQDYLGNPVSSSTVNVVVDSQTITPTLSSPKNNETFGQKIPISLTLGESYLSNSAKLIFTNTSGTYTNTIFLIDNTLSQSFTLTTKNIAGSNITSSTYTNLPDDNYNVKLSYQDVFGHQPSVVTVSNISIRTSTLTPTIISPVNGTVFNKSNPPSITYNLPSAPYTGTAILTLSPGYSYTLSSQSGTNTYTFSTNIPLNGTYTCTIRYRDYLGNPVAISSPISVTFDQLNSTPTISANGFENKKTIADWTKQNGPASTVWWDMDGDGKSDKIYFQMSANGFGLFIYKYDGNCFKKTFDVNDLVVGDSLRTLYKQIASTWGASKSMQTGASLSVVDFNKDNIPDLLFEVGTMESDIASNNITAYDILLVSKGWLNYEMHTFPTSAHAQMTSSGDFNGDGYPDLWKSSVTMNNSYSSFHMIRYFNKDYTTKEVVLEELGRQDDQGTSYITDIDNNGMPDIFIGERDYNIDLGNGIPGKSPRLFMNVNNGFYDLDKSLYDVNFQQKWNISPTRFQITQSIDFADLNNDGLKDIILNKVHSDGAPAGQTSDGRVDALKAETVLEIFQNDGNGNFHDITSTWFKNNSEYFKRPLNSAGKFFPPGGGNPNPGDIKMSDVDADGLVDIAFVYYGNIYYKNMGDHFEFKRNDDGFNFMSQKYRSVPDGSYKLNNIRINGYLTIPYNENQTTISVDTTNNTDQTKWYKENSMIGSQNKLTVNTEGNYKVVRIDSLGCEYSQSFKIIKGVQMGVRYRSYPFTADSATIANGLGNAFPALNEATSGSILYTLNGTEHIIGTPAEGNKALPPVHFINKNGKWEFDRFSTYVTMGNARNYVFIDSSTIAMADHGLESGNPWPYGDIYTIKTQNDTLSWKKISQYKSFFHSVGVGDINSDGLYDLVGLHMGSYNTWKGNNGLQPFVQNTDGSFSEGKNLIEDQKEFGGGGSVLIADIMGDKTPEIIEGQYGSGGPLYGFTIYNYDKNSNKYTYYKRPGNSGVFADDKQGSTSIKLADFNNDGLKDMAIASEGYPGTMLQIWTNDGKGDYVPGQVLNYPDVIPTGYPDSSNTFREFEIADVDNDGWLDILVHPFHFGNKFRINPGPQNPNKTNGGWSGSGIYLQNQIWKNFGGYFNTIQNDLSVYGTFPGFIKGTYINNKLKYFGFEGNGMNSVKINEYTITFCKDLVKPVFNSDKFNFCSGDSVNLSISNVKSGDTLKWNINGVLNNDFNNLKTIKTSSKIYVSRVDSLGCTINSDTVNIVVKSDLQPNIPKVSDTSFCQNNPLPELKAVADGQNSLLWYGNNSIGGSGTAKTQIASTTDTTIKYYYVSQLNSTTGCESARAKLSVKILPSPSIPKISDTTYCNNVNADTLRVNPNIGNIILWYGTNATGGVSSKTPIKPNTSSVGILNYYLTQQNVINGCESDRAKVVINILSNPSIPIISRDTSGYLVSSNSYGNNWFKEAVALTDTTQKIKPAIAGSYTVKTIQNGCPSILSNPYYYLITDIVNLSYDEFIKLAPNPFSSILNFDFNIKGYQKVNLEVFEISTGNKVRAFQNLIPGQSINLGNLTSGTYLVKVSTSDNKIVQQFKMVKI